MIIKIVKSSIDFNLQVLYHLKSGPHDTRGIRILIDSDNDEITLVEHSKEINAGEVHLLKKNIRENTS